MFHSNTSGSSDIQFTDQAMFDRSFINDVNPHHSKQQEPEPPLLLFHLPQSFVVNDYHHQHHDQHHHKHRHHQEEEDDDFLHNNHHELLVNQLFPQEQQQQQLLTGNITSSTVAVSNKAIMTGCPSNMLPGKKKYSSSTLTGQIPRKRSAKKDRHSKIFTAQGPRDRRMRLSLEIARKFFDLQDILGFDKASKTVEWLLMQSMGAIKELTGGLNINTKSSCNGADKSVSSTSECEVISTINDNSNKGNPSASVPKEKKLSQSRKTTFPPPSKESRAKARAKARERAREKKLNRRLEESKRCPEITVPHYLNQFRSSSPSGNHSHEMKSSLEVVAEIDEPDYHRRTTTGDIVDESFVITSKLSPLAPMVFDYSRGAAISQGLSSNNNFPSFLENWDIEGNRTQPNYYAMTNSHPSTGNVQERLSSSIFLTTSDIRFQSQFADILF